MEMIRHASRLIALLIFASALASPEAVPLNKGDAIEAERLHFEATGLSDQGKSVKSAEVAKRAEDLFGRTFPVGKPLEIGFDCPIVVVSSIELRLSCSHDILGKAISIQYVDSSHAGAELLATKDFWTSDNVASQLQDLKPGQRFRAKFRPVPNYWRPSQTVFSRSIYGGFIVRVQFLSIEPEVSNSVAPIDRSDAFSPSVILAKLRNGEEVPRAEIIRALEMALTTKP
ncbi:MAG: hypothetical protein JNM27_15440 [Leptospirales bacterium]|nr:hypothetical protein [Leptospirales bacterium]